MGIIGSSTGTSMRTLRSLALLGMITTSIFCYQFYESIINALPDPRHFLQPRSSSRPEWLTLDVALLRDVAHESAGEYLGSGFIPSFFLGLSLLEAQSLFYGAVRQTPHKCSKMERIGRRGDGGYQVCVQESYKPKYNNCLVYSFGINNEWSFDEGMNRQYGCEIHSFDPSMQKTDHLHKENMYFHNLGLWGQNIRNERGWELRTLESIVGTLNHQQRTIDYLKVDVEGAEWSLIEHIIRSGIHSNIKQMAIEIHTPRLVQKIEHMSLIDYGEIYHGLHQLANVGFKKYLYRSNNNCCGRFTVMVPAQIAQKSICCFEIFFINSNVS